MTSLWGSRVPVVVLSAGLVALLSACLPRPDGAPLRLTGVSLELADPAAVPMSGGRMQVYTTNADVEGWRHIPTWTSDPARPGPVVHVADALPTLPWWVQHNPADPFPRPIVWAPTVRLLAGRYVLMYAGGRSDGAVCINVAVSPRPTGPFAPVAVAGTGGWCDPFVASTGWLDPQIVVFGSAVYLYWAIHEGPGRSWIAAQALSPDGLQRVGPMVRLVGFEDVSLVGGPNGTNPFVENPAMTTGGEHFLLTVSVGTFFEVGYRTIGLLCTSPLGGCSLPEQLDLGGRDPTSLSYVTDGLPARAVYTLRSPAYTGLRGIWSINMTAPS